MLKVIFTDFQQLRSSIGADRCRSRSTGQQRQTLRKLLDYLEEALGDKAYFLGEFSLTDIDLWPRFGRMEDYGVLPTPSLPRLSGWLKRMKERPSIKALR